MPPPQVREHSDHLPHVPQPPLTASGLSPITTHFLRKHHYDNIFYNNFDYRGLKNRNTLFSAHFVPSAGGSPFDTQLVGVFLHNNLSQNESSDILHTTDPGNIMLHCASPSYIAPGSILSIGSKLISGSSLRHSPKSLLEI